MDYVRFTWARPLVVVLLYLGSAASASAQSAGTLTGTVVDSTGAALPGATVTATDATTATVRPVVSNEAGLFRIPALNSGRYTVKVELTGFKPLSIEDINLLSLETRDLGKITLQLGSLQENLTVVADVTPVQISDSSLMKTITLEDLKNIQVKGRDMYAMLALLPGVQDTNLNRDYATWTSASAITINGAPTINKDLRVDGLNIVDEGGCSTGFVNLNMDAIGQIQVMTNGYTAENGRNNGGIISVVTKSGTSALKASGWYNGRRDRFNANDYFRKATNLPKPLYRINISGYAVGGPIVIPGLVDSRDTSGSPASSKKFYFFASQEYTDDARPTTTTRANMPTALENAGDFSQTRTTNGTIQPIIDPLTGLPFAGNVIPASRINPLGQKMLNLLPTANGILDPTTGNAWTSNSAYDLTPLHSRTNHVFRMDGVFSEKTRMSARLIKDRDDNWSWNAFTPGTGFINQDTPGILMSGTVTKIIRPTVVNEMNFGYTHNRWGFKAADNFDYTSLYASTLGINAPRILPFSSFSDPPVLSGFGGAQVDEWPYAPRFTTSGGNRANLGCYHTCSNSNEPIPRLNISARGSFADNLSIIKGRHNIKMGLYLEYNKKTEPGSADYMGNFNFGHDANNPLSTGNGYANMLLGIYTTYTELTSRVDKDVRHWQNDAFIQDNWRATSRLTIDYGLRLQHSGSDFEVNHMNSGFFANRWAPKQAPRVYRLVCMDGRPGDQPCPSNLQRAVDPAFPTIFFSPAFSGNIVSGTGNQINGIVTEGIPGEKRGTYFHFPYLVAAPRVGFAWNVGGDGRTALRGSFGIFYNFPRSTGTGGYPFAGGCPLSCSDQIRWATFDDISTAAAAGNRFVQNPVNVNLGGYNQGLAKSYNVNVAYQRDIGFNTVAEAAYVGNFQFEPGRFVDINRLPLYVFGNPANLVNNAPLNSNYLRAVYGQYPGMGSVTAFVPNLYPQSLRYNGMQLNVVRRLSRGLQMGMAYTLSQAVGYTGYDPYTDAIGGEAAIKARYWGATPEDRRHNLAVSYSYDIPTLTTAPILKQVLHDWQISGVTKLQSGQAVTPTCTSNNSGIANTNPSLTDTFYPSSPTTALSRCELTGAPIFSGYTVDPNVPFADQPHFNLAAFRMPQPTGSVGNFGNSPVGLLRNPTWHEWDLTLSRRFPISMGGRKNSGIRVQLQAYNVFNEVQFTTLNATYTFTGPNNSVNNNANTGKYVASGGSNLAAGTIQPRTMGLTVRLDW
jgi:hypothetical protein